jgi:hypothetical protein
MKITPNKTKVVWTSKEDGKSRTSAVASVNRDTVWVVKRNRMLVPLTVGEYEVVS